jgi:hypothetical protein
VQRISFTSLLFTPFLLAACGGSKSTTPPPSAEPLPLTALCDVIRGDLCTAMIECYGWPYRDLDHCMADQECLGMADLEAEVASGAVAYDPAVAGRCHAAFQENPCGYGFYFGVPSVSDVLADCQEVLLEPIGTIAAGGACTTALACDAGSVCVFDASCPGTCQALLPEDAACDGTSGVRCNFRDGLDCVDGLCKPVPLDGLRCEADDECGPGAICNDQWLPHGICDSGAIEGAVCGGATDTECQLGLFCDAELFEADAEGICRALGQPAGGPCVWDDNCSDGLFCFVEDIATSTLGECTERLGAAEPCGSRAECEEGLRCGAEGVCAPLADVSEACVRDDDCLAGLVCDGVTCKEARYPGEGCGEPTVVCVESICDGASCVGRYDLGQSCVSDDECRSRTCGGAGSCEDPELCAAPR